MLLPGAALVGLSASFLWIAQGMYITESATGHAILNQEEDKKSSLGLFNGIFFAFFQFTQLSSNLAASILLNNKWSVGQLMILYCCCAGAGLAGLGFGEPGGPERYLGSISNYLGAVGVSLGYHSI